MELIDPGLIGRLVALACRHARTFVAVPLLFALACGTYVAGQFAVSTDTAALISDQAPWRRHEVALARAFPGRDDDITVVIDGQTPELAEQAAAGLATRLSARRDLFTTVSRPEGGPFFDQEGLLFAPVADVRRTTAALIAGQPVLGPIAADPSLRGVLTGLNGALAGVREDPSRAPDLERVVRKLGFVLDRVLQGRPVAFSWRPLLTGETPDRSELRRFLILRPRVDYGRTNPGEEAMSAVRRAATQSGHTPAAGVTVRLTGTVPLQEDELSTLAEMVGPIALFMLITVVGMLYLAARSARLIGCIVATVLVGLAMTAAGGLALFGRFNLISVAFFPLFIGLGVDFAIQFSVRYRAERVGRLGPEALVEALVVAGRGVGGALALAAASTGVGFFAFLPTAYVGVSELGLMAGVGMIVAFLLSITFLPALILLVRPPGEAAEVGFAALANADAWVLSRRRSIVGGALVAAVVCAVLTPWLRIDLDPMALRDPKSESVSTLRDLARGAETTPNALDVLAPSLPAAQKLAARLAALPEVDKATTLASFVPQHQAENLPVIIDAQSLLDLTLNPFESAPPPTDVDLVVALRSTAAALRGAQDPSTANLPESEPAPSDRRRLAGMMDQLAAGSPERRARAQAALSAGLPGLLSRIRTALTAQPISIQTLPPELRNDWVASDARARVQVFPRGDETDPLVLQRFTTAVRRVAPNAVGLPIAVQESGRTILAAFAEAGVLALLAVTALLFAVLKNARHVGLTLAPVALTTLLTLGTCVALGRSLNLENLIALPLMLGIGVAFNIYFVMAWREGEKRLLASSLTRAVLFSALTTACAVGSLWLSSHPGTASMGELLLISLVWTLVTALGFQPALLGDLEGLRGAETNGPEVTLVRG